MRVTHFRYLQKHARAVLLLLGAGMFLVQAGERDPATASQATSSLELGYQDSQNKNDIRHPDWFRPLAAREHRVGLVPTRQPPGADNSVGAIGSHQHPDRLRRDGDADAGGVLRAVRRPARRNSARMSLISGRRRAGAGGTPPEPREGRSGHLLTGPIYIDNAEPGDTLEVQILDLNTRVPYGINSTSPNGGVFSLTYPGRRAGGSRSGAAGHTGGRDDPRRPTASVSDTKVKGRDVALFSESIHVPLGPFMGVMGVAPLDPIVGQPGVTVPGVQASGPPGRFGGNMDLKHLTRGNHAVSAGLPSGRAILHGRPAFGPGRRRGQRHRHRAFAAGVFRFILHKGKTIEWPRAENADYYILMGIDLDLDRAMRIAVLEVVKFLVEEKGLTQAKAFSLASIAVDFRVAEVVDGTQVVTGNIPKSLFLKQPSLPR